MRYKRPNGFLSGSSHYFNRAPVERDPVRLSPLSVPARVSSGLRDRWKSPVSDHRAARRLCPFQVAERVAFKRTLSPMVAPPADRGIDHSPTPLVPTLLTAQARTTFQCSPDLISRSPVQIRVLACLSYNELRKIPKNEKNRALQLLCILAARRVAFASGLNDRRFSCYVLALPRCGEEFPVCSVQTSLNKQ